MNFCQGQKKHCNRNKYLLYRYLSWQNLRYHFSDFFYWTKLNLKLYVFETVLLIIKKGNNKNSTQNFKEVLLP